MIEFGQTAPEDAVRGQRKKQITEPVPYTNAQTLRIGYEVRYPWLFDRYPVEDYIERLDATPTGTAYRHIAPEVKKFWNVVLDDYGQDALESYNRVTMLVLIEKFDERSAGRNYPDSVIARYRSSFKRIERTIGSSELGTYAHTSDIFLKDFAICRQKAFPAGGAHIVDEYSGFSRAALLSDGVGQFFRFLFFLLFVSRGNSPFYVTHTHLSEVDDFGPEGRNDCYARIAEMLERHPEMKGMYSSSWFNDPALADISPRLAYLRRVPTENGAWLFRVGEDIEGGALAKSATRRKLHEDGKYIPTAYLVVWPRRKIIAWAKRHK